MSPTPEPRIGDAERDAAIRALGEHYAAGRLTKEEYDERADTALRARTNSDLRPLFVDLPRGAGQYAGRPGGQAWGTTEPPRRHGYAHQQGRRGAPPAVWMVAPVLIPVFVGLAIFLTVVSGAWWLIFIACWFFWWGPHRYRRGPWGR